MARILLISDEEAIGLLWGASAAGHEVIVTGVRSRNPTVSMSPKANKFIPLPETASFIDEEQFDDLAETIGALANEQAVDVIVPTSFESLKFAVLQHDRLSVAAPLIPLATMEQIMLLDDKYSFYQFCCANDLPHPASCLIESRDDLGKRELSCLTFPLLTKPLLGSATGIEKFQTRDELDHRIATAGPDFFPVLAQEWFEGEDIDFNGYALNGAVAVSSVMRTTVYDRNGIETSLTDFIKHAEISRLGSAIVRMSSFTGPLNVDLRIREADQKVFLIEVNPRFWGRSMACLIDGLSFVDAGIQLAFDPKWRATSRSDGTVWASSIVPLVRGAVSGDKRAFGFLRRVSAIQIGFQLQARGLGMISRLRNRVVSHG
ncbi:MAG: ATP-grasp domain-containing protein [Hyphomicrobiaceae bacterium]